MRELQDLKQQLHDTQNEAVRSKDDLEARVVLATAKLETTRIELVGGCHPSNFELPALHTLAFPVADTRSSYLERVFVVSMRITDHHANK